MGKILDHKKQIVNNIAILTLVTIALILILLLLQPYLKTVFLAAIMAAITSPIYTRIHSWITSKNLSSILTLLVFSLCIVLPMLFVFSMIISQMGELTNFLATMVENLNNNQSIIETWNSRVPDFLQADKIVSTILSSLEQIRGFFIENFSAFTSSAMRWFVLFFIFYYAMYFFLKDGKTILQKFLYYIPMNADNTTQVLDSFVQVSKATLKGTLIIWMIQGILAGIGFWVAGIPGAAFWTVVMIVLSVIPVIGSAIVWVPVCIILFLSWDTTTAIALGLYCMVIVSGIDNLLRPKLVGKDTQMPELMILLSTFWGLNVFWMSGIILWPVIAAFFLSMLQIYGTTFTEYLSKTPLSSPSKKIKKSKHKFQKNN